MMSHTMWWRLLLAVLAVSVHVARADIYEWRDGRGVRHFANSREELPAAGRETATVVLREPAPGRRTGGPQALPEQPAVPAREEPRLAPVVYDQAAVTAAYTEGWRDGAEAGGYGGARILAAPAVYFRGPVAAVWNRVFEYPPVVARLPLVTTSFDRGRSRHLTLRLLMQEQFAIDREGPFVFRERSLPWRHHLPLAPRLYPFLPRGLPHGWPLHTRVVTR